MFLNILILFLIILPINGQALDTTTIIIDNSEIKDINSDTTTIDYGENNYKSEENNEEDKIIEIDIFIIEEKNSKENKASTVEP
uniref:Secreted protein n=1 Tax=Meloidogyne floridensis TaxID=298350 RepID=A0A915P732_9BILA